jgi:D-beta-D-heptose 7-phosphate kinase/D-beta-D-heptose 1-phosphate adenosyltransferase
MKVIVIGDIMIDINHFSKIERNAPESIDIPIHEIYDTTYNLGGASNVAQNLSSLNVNTELISVIGNDFFGKKIQELLEEKRIKNKLFIDNSRKTTQKNRIFHKNKLSFRYDIEDRSYINEELYKNIIQYIKNSKDIKAIVISDYCKGVLHFELTKEIITYANLNNIYTFVDPKVKDFLKYENCFCFKPNLLESETISSSQNMNEIVHFLKENIKTKHLIITCGKDGIFVEDLNTVIKHDTGINVLDVTGSGDIVLAVLVYVYLFVCNDMIIASKIANYIAGKGVSVLGNYIIDKNDINNYLLLNNIVKSSCDKIIYDYEINKIRDIKSLNNDNKIIFTNGCFDILHSAHIKLLQFAKSKGKILVVGLNSDESIKRLKGENRPINTIDERSAMLSLFDFIDHVIVFNDDTPLNVIQLLKPNIIIKGSDYKKENVVGSEYVDEIILFDFISNKSSSLVINKIKNQKKDIYL